MGNGPRAKTKTKKPGRLKDLAVKAKQVTAVRGGVTSSGNEPGTLKRAGY
jgi:hypothetical protein